MTGPTWQSMFLLLLLYLGAFLSGLRPARWFGTRLLPLLGALLLTFFNVLLGFSLSFPLALVLCGLLVANICFVARVSDYA